MVYFTVFVIFRFRVLQKIVKRRFVTNVTKTVTNHSNRVAVIDSNGSFSYNQIYEQAQLIASRLEAKPGMIFLLWVSRIDVLDFSFSKNQLKATDFVSWSNLDQDRSLWCNKIWSYTEENWLCYQTDYVHRSLIRVCLVSLGSMDQRPHCSSYVCKASSSGTQGRFQIDNCPLVVLLLIWNLFSVMLFRILNQLQSTVRNYSMKCFSKWTKSTICLI